MNWSEDEKVVCLCLFDRIDLPVAVKNFISKHANGRRDTHQGENTRGVQ